LLIRQEECVVFSDWSSFLLLVYLSLPGMDRDATLGIKSNVISFTAHYLQKLFQKPMINVKIYDSLSMLSVKRGV